MAVQKTWWYSRLNEIYRGLHMGGHAMSTEDRLELCRMLVETLSLVDDLGREA